MSHSPRDPTTLGILESLQTRTARRSDLYQGAHRNSDPHLGGSSVPTPRRLIGTSRLIGLHPEFPLTTQPHHDTSEVGRFLRKRHVGRHGPLEDLSLPRRLVGLNPRCFIGRRSFAGNKALKEADSTHEVNITHIVHSAGTPEKAVFTGEIVLRGFDQSTRSAPPKEPLRHGIFCSSACVHESSRFDSSARTVLTASAKTGAAAWPHSRRMYVKESAIWVSSRASAKAGMFSS